MANQQKNQNENPLVAWVLTVIMLCAFWPVGLIMLFRMLTAGSITSPRKQDPNRPIDVRAREVRADSPAQRPAAPQSAQARKQPAPRTAHGSNPISIGKGWGRGFILAGAIVAGIFGIALVSALADLLSWGYASYMLRELIYLTGLTATGLVLLFCGVGRRKKAARYRRYLTLIGKRESLSVEALAKAMPVSYRRACEDLQDMLERGFLPSGYLDASERRIVFSNGGILEQQPPKEAKTEAPSPDVSVLSEIQAINDEIDNVAMSEKIDRIGEITGKILDYQRNNPKSSADSRNFLSYYLPTTLKILRSYAQLEAQGIEGENITSTKARIEGMMDKVVEGFEKQLDKLFRADALDISSDVQVMEQMLKRDGLSADDLLQMERLL